MPVLFSALQPDMPIEIVETVLESLDKYEEKLHHLFWLDCNVLQVAIRRRCSVQVTKLLINQGEFTVYGSNCFGTSCDPR